MVRIPLIAAALVVGSAATEADPVAVSLLPSQITSSATANASLTVLAAPDFDHSQYVETARAIQDFCASTYDIALWVGIASTNESTSLSGFLTADDVDSALAFTHGRLESAVGLPNTPVSTFVAAHSPTVGHAVQQWAYNSTDHSVPDADAIVLMGGFIGRSIRNTVLEGSSKIPILTFAASLDGVSRFSRNGAEALYHQNLSSAPVVVLPGASHAQYASGAVPLSVQQQDLRPTANDTDVRKGIAAACGAFFASDAVGVPDLPSASHDLATKTMDSLSQNASKEVQPLIRAMQLEGSKYLNEPCNSDFPTNPTCNYPQYPDQSLIPTPIPKPDPMPSSSCTCGSEWVMREAQAIMANFQSTSHMSTLRGGDQPSVTTSDAFHDVSDVHPFHLPHIWNECDRPDDNCELNVTTVTMPMYVVVCVKRLAGFKTSTALHVVIFPQRGSVIVVDTRMTPRMMGQ